MSNNSYTCAICHNTYEKGLSDEEAMQETQQYFPGTKQEECGIVCDDCWQLIKPDQKIDPFEQVLNKWMRDNYLDNKAERERRNADTLIKTLECQGHHVRISEDYRYIHVDELATITMVNAREVPVETLAKFVDKVMEREKSKK